MHGTYVGRKACHTIGRWMIEQPRLIKSNKSKKWNCYVHLFVNQSINQSTKLSSAVLLNMYRWLGCCMIIILTPPIHFRRESALQHAISKQLANVTCNLIILDAGNYVSMRVQKVHADWEFMYPTVQDVGCQISLLHHQNLRPFELWINFLTQTCDLVLTVYMWWAHNYLSNVVNFFSCHQIMLSKLSEAVANYR
jgi:hypothetical protein